MTLFRDWWRLGRPREWRDEFGREVKTVVEGAPPPYVDIWTIKRPGTPLVRLVHTHWGLKLMIRRCDADTSKPDNVRLRRIIAKWPQTLDKEIIWCNEDWSPADE